MKTCGAAPLNALRAPALLPREQSIDCNTSWPFDRISVPFHLNRRQRANLKSVARRSVISLRESTSVQDLIDGERQSKRFWNFDIQTFTNKICEWSCGTNTNWIIVWASALEPRAETPPYYRTPYWLPPVDCSVRCIVCTAYVQRAGTSFIHIHRTTTGPQESRNVQILNLRGS